MCDIVKSISYEWIYDFTIGTEVLDQRISPSEIDELPLSEADLNEISFNDSLATYSDYGV